jgi:ABC-type transport system involved in cytochrome c biogenesis permease subunit
MTPAQDTGQQDRTRGGSGSRLAVASLVGLITGLGVALASGSVFDGVPLGGRWGSINGTLAFLAGFGVTLLLGRRSPHRRLGGAVLAVAAGLVSLGAWSFIYAYQVFPHDA